MQDTGNNEMGSTAPEQSLSFLARLFTGWGVPGSLARILAGAVLGALSAFWAMSQSGCMAEWTLRSPGSVWHGRAASLMPLGEPFCK